MGKRQRGAARRATRAPWREYTGPTAHGRPRGSQPKAASAVDGGDDRAWADSHRERTGRWPRVRSGPIRDAPGETWSGVETALEKGNRGLPGGSSLVKLLVEHRGARHPKHPPPLTRQQIVAWARAHHRRTGTWPTPESGPIEDAPGETWKGIEMALVEGRRGLRGLSSLYRLLIRHWRIPGRASAGKDRPRKPKGWRRRRRAQEHMRH
jgi:hypothetical protein